MGMVFCRYCGKEIHETAPTCPHCGAIQAVAKQRKNTTIPDGIKGWSWGAFLLNWIWAIGNRTWIGLLALIPLAGIIMAFALGFKGREWAWRNKHWESLEHFNRVQRKWSIWGIVLVACGIFIYAVLEISAFQDFVNRAKQAELHQHEQLPYEAPLTDLVSISTSKNDEAQPTFNVHPNSPSIDESEEALPAPIRSSLQQALADTTVMRTAFRNTADESAWLKEMSRRLASRMPDETERLEFLTTLHWEASRAGIDPQLLLGLIQVESGFDKYHVSPKGARGYTQVMPFWTKAIGSPDHNLFQLRTNLRYGALILRHYIDIEKGDIYRALERYGNRTGPEHPTLVVGAWKRHWDYTLPIHNLDAGKDSEVVDKSYTEERREEVTKAQTERGRLNKAEGEECQTSAECAEILVCAKVTPTIMQCMTSDAALKQYVKFP